MIRGVFVAVVVGSVALAAQAPAPWAPPAPSWAGAHRGLEPEKPSFDHLEHSRLFPTCSVCHAGAAEPGEPLWPDAASCAACHDGEIEEPVEWTEPRVSRTNLRFDHLEHAREMQEHGKEAARCTDCHIESGSPWMAVQLTVVQQCLDCHGIDRPHHAAPDRECATCHLPLSRAVRLTAEDVKGFSIPASHLDPGFADRSGHGLLAVGPPGHPAPSGVAASCATCHARDFCMNCHVDAPEQRAVQALERDDRSLALTAVLRAPDDHYEPLFLEEHGPAVLSNPVECRTCHTQESCLACHAANPMLPRELYAWNPERSRGAVPERRLPDSHRGDFVARHGILASARPDACAACHVRQDCLDCHRPGAATVGTYHPSTFLARHPAAAYARETSCSDCHNPTRFCMDCHQQAGLRSQRPLLAGYHDAKRFWIAGHGQAARQNLESCVSCHVERDCLTCHSALGGRRFNPHGPSFDAERLKRRNPEVCMACHGMAIP